MMKASVFVAESWEEKELKNLLGDRLAFTFFQDPLNKDRIPNDTEADILAVFVDSHIDADVIAAFPNLKLIATRSTGFDHIDLVAAKARGITVSNVPSYGENTVAEHAFGLLLALSKRIYDGFDQIREKSDYDPHKLRGFDLMGKTLGVIGTGRIGKHAIKIGKGFGMRIIAYDPMPDQAYAAAEGFSYQSLEELLGTSDVITIHVPYIAAMEGNPGTHHLINLASLSHMKPGLVLVNTSRGAVVETEALVRGLKDKTLGGVCLDVFEEEGGVKDEIDLLVSGKVSEHDIKTMLMNHALVDMPNVIITPHSAFNTKEALERILHTTIENIEGFLEGAPKHTITS